MKKILLAGGGGYIGSQLFNYLEELKYDVHVIDCFWFGNHLPRQAKRQHKNLFKCTVEDFKGYDTVILLAGLSNDPMAEFSPSANYIYNCALPTFVSDMCHRAGVPRLIFASSCSVYGFTNNIPSTEESPINCSYPYGISKYIGECGANYFCDDKMSVITFRQGTVSGYSPRMRFDLIVNAMFKTAMTDRKIVMSNPNIWRPILHIKDACRAYVKAIEAPQDISGVFNISSGNYTVGEVATIVKEVVELAKLKEITIENRNIKDNRNYLASIKKAATVLRFVPMYDVRMIVRELLKHAPYKYTRDIFYNINTFKKIGKSL